MLQHLKYKICLSDDVVSSSGRGVPVLNHRVREARTKVKSLGHNLLLYPGTPGTRGYQYNLTCTIRLGLVQWEGFLSARPDRLSSVGGFPQPEYTGIIINTTEFEVQIKICTDPEVLITILPQDAPVRHSLCIRAPFFAWKQAVAIAQNASLSRCQGPLSRQYKHAMVHNCTPFWYNVQISRLS